MSMVRSKEQTICSGAGGKSFGSGALQIGGNLAVLKEYTFDTPWPIRPGMRAISPFIYLDKHG